MTLHILIADPHPLTLAGLCHSLDNASRGRLQVSATARSTEQLLHTLERQRFDLLVSDDSVLGHLTGLQTIRRRFSRVPVMVLTSLAEACALGSILATGVKALVSKCNSVEQLRIAALHAATGRRVICPYTQAVLAQRYLNRKAWASEAAGRLTALEREVLGLARLDLSIRQIAHRLGRSERGVTTLRRKALEKLGLRPDALLWNCPALSAE